MAKLKITEEKIKQISTMIRNHLYVEHLCPAVGISKVTYYNWLNEGMEIFESGKKPRSNRGKLMLAFFNAVKAAEAASQEELLKTVKAHSFKSWQAATWILERKYPKQWGRLQSIDMDLSGSVGVKKEKSDIDVSKLSDEDLEILNGIFQKLEGEEDDS